MHLRRGVKWHDGVPVTAHDVEFTVSMWNDPQIAFFAGGLVESVEVLLAKARAYSVAGDEAAALRSLERVMVLDPSRQDVRRRLAEKRMELAGESRE